MKIIEKFIKKFQKFLKITHGSNLNLVTNQLRTTFQLGLVRFTKYSANRQP